MTIPPEMLEKKISILDAFDAMRHFLEAYWERGGKTSSDISLLLTYIDRDEGTLDMPFDQAQWHDWLNALNEVK